MYADDQLLPKTIKLDQGGLKDWKEVLWDITSWRLTLHNQIWIVVY